MPPNPKLGVAVAKFDLSASGTMLSILEHLSIIRIDDLTVV